MKGKHTENVILSSSPEQASWLGCMRGTGKITGNILSPAEELDAWEVLAQTDEFIRFLQQFETGAAFYVRAASMLDQYELDGLVQEIQSQRAEMDS